MSSVGASDRSANDRVRKTREEYETRDAENQKKKKAEIDSLSQKHYEEIRRLSDDFEREMEELKNQYRTSLSERDQSNNRKIEEVRNLYKEQLRKKTEENEADRRQMRAANDGALQKQKNISEMQKEHLLETHQEEVARQNEKFQELSQRNRQEMQESLSGHDQKLKEAHAKEINATIQDRDLQLSNKDRDNRETRKAYEAKLNQLRLQKEGEISRWNQKYRDTVANHQEQEADQLRTQGELLRGELDELNRRYAKAIDKKYQQLDDANQELRDSVNERLNGQVRSKQSQVDRLNSKLNHQMVNDERLRNIERRNLEGKYAEQMDLLEKQKEGSLADMKEVNRQRIDQMVEQTNKLLRDTTREHKSETSLMNQRNRQDRELVKQQHAESLDLVTGNAEDRIKKITQLSRANQEAYSTYFDNSVDQLRDNYTERVASQQERSTEDLVRLNKAMSDRFRGMEKSFNQKLEHLTNTYEYKMNQMKDNQEKEIKRIETYYTQRLANRDKETKQQTGSLEMKYEAKIAQLNEAHEEQLDRMNRRHQEDMQNLATRMSNYSKKA